MVEKRGQQALRIDPHRRRVNRRNQLRVRGRNKVTQINVFHLIPTRLDRIQLRRIRRKVVELEPARMLVAEIILGGMMSRKMIPKYQHLAADKIMKGGQKENEVLEPRRILENREAKFQEMSDGSPGDEAEPRMIVTTGRFKKERRLADRRPSAATIGNERKTAFIPDRQGQTVVVGFFLMRGQTCFRQSSTAACEYLVDLTSGC